MTRDHLLTAIREGIPFTIKMADGEKYTVSQSHEIAVGKTSVVVVKGDQAHWLPLLTMTGISYRPHGKSRK
jgi:hypothetical protein